MVYKSFKDAFTALGYTVKPNEQKEKEVKCKVCGSVMEHKADSNLYICHGVKKDKDGNETPCTNYILRHSESNI